MTRDPYPGLGGRDPDEVERLAKRIVDIILVTIAIVAGPGLVAWVVLS